MSYSLLAFLPFVLFVSCSQEQDIAGKWQELRKAATLELYRDSTFNAVDDMGMAVSGKYTLQENGKIGFEIIHQGSSPEIINGKLTMRGDQPIFTSVDDKKVETYKRAK